MRSWAAEAAAGFYKTFACHGCTMVLSGMYVCESASSPLVCFGGLNDNIIKGLTSLLSVEQEIESIAYTYGLWNEK